MHMRATEQPNPSFSCFMNEAAGQQPYDGERGAQVRCLWAGVQEFLISALLSLALCRAATKGD